MTLFGPPDVERLRRKRKVPALIEALNFVDDQIRAGAAAALGDIGDPRAVEPLIIAMRDPWSPAVRRAAAESLGRFRDARAIPHLVATLGDDWMFVRLAAAEALAATGEPALEPVIEALSGVSPTERAMATVVLGRMRDARAVQPLLWAAADHDADVRLFAVTSLGMLRDVRAIDALVAALRDNEESVRAAAVDALEHVDDPRAAAALAAAKRAG